MHIFYRRNFAKNFNVVFCHYRDVSEQIQQNSNFIHYSTSAVSSCRRLLAPPLLSSLSQSATVIDSTQHTHTAHESRQHQPNSPSCAAVCFLRHHHRRARSPTRRKRSGFLFCLSRRGSGAAVRERLGEREEEN
ncbi:hypothetical protein M9H77_16316 [Catharanthus roseus]|uniref:Uncharacterized protein n=1 Tax=Catharanthus roseus TaxID=4058 RepID=A0ACC0B1F6_CATRO|nr:hypothetical protein M9H77_16316 [Catharanthus roseus]